MLKILHIEACEKCYSFDIGIMKVSLIDFSLHDHHILSIVAKDKN